jgi:peptidoglycan/LPS O-acetylase OafA/YrhL
MLICHFGCEANSAAGNRWHSYLMEAGSLSWSGVNLFFVLSGTLFGCIFLKVHNSPNYFKAFYAHSFFRITPIYAEVVASPSPAAPRFFNGVTS